MDYKIMTLSQVWQDFDPNGEPLKAAVSREYEEDGLNFKLSTFCAMSAPDGDVTVALKIISAAPSDNFILIVQDYENRAQDEVIADLARRGYTVAVPDCSGIGGGHRTLFPPSLEYGDIKKAGEHVTAVCPTAKDTSQYLYSVIVMRTITYILNELSGKSIMLAGIGDGTETAMQVAGIDKRVIGLVLINGAGYKEYKNLNKYGGKQDLKIDQRLLCWLTGVAGVSYAKHIDVPVFIAVGSNSEFADIDRLSNLLGLFKEHQARISITPSSRKAISPQAYASMNMWIDDIFGGAELPKRPRIDIRASEENLYLEITADSLRHIKEVTAYYSYGEYDHLVRNWTAQKCEAVSKEQYLAKLDAVPNDGPIFAFCEVAYKNGFSAFSFEDYAELGELGLRKADFSFGRIVYEASMGTGAFSEDSPKDILLRTGLEIKATPLGLKGIAAAGGALINFDIGRLAPYNKGRLLQIDIYSPKDDVLTVKLLVKRAETVDEYTASICLKASDGAFVSHKLLANEFKNSRLMALDDWDGVKAIKMSGEGVVVGKILFI